MKTLAIILYGVTRGQAQKTSVNFHNFIVNYFKNFFLLDIYLHCFEMKECIVDPQRDKSIFKIKNPQDWKFFNAKHYASDCQEKFVKQINYSDYISNCRDPFHNGMMSVKNYINSLHSLKKSFQLSSDKLYDCYFVSRLDLLYQNNTGLLDSCLDVCNNPQSNILYTPNWNKAKGLNDRIAIGNHQVIDRYCSRIDSYLGLKSLNRNNIHSESLLLTMSKKNKFINKHFKCYAARIRSNGHIQKN